MRNRYHHNRLISYFDELLRDPAGGDDAPVQRERHVLETAAGRRVVVVVQARTVSVSIVHEPLYPGSVGCITGSRCDLGQATEEEKAREE